MSLLGRGLMVERWCGAPCVGPSPLTLARAVLLGLLLALDGPRGDAQAVLRPNIIACTNNNPAACNHGLQVTAGPPLAPTSNPDPYIRANCVTPGFTCLPVQKPIGDWFSAWVSHSTGTGMLPLRVR